MKLNQTREWGAYISKNYKILKKWIPCEGDPIRIIGLNSQQIQTSQTTLQYALST